MSLLCPWCDKKFPKYYTKKNVFGNLVKDFISMEQNFNKHIKKCKSKWDKKQKKYIKEMESERRDT